MHEFQKRRILIVDDDQRLLEFLKPFLTQHQYGVECAATGEEALSSLKSNAVDIILLDIFLPDMTGFDVLRRIGENTLDSAIIVLTAHSSEDTAIEALRLGASDYVVKPFSPKNLLARIERVLQSLAARREKERLASDLANKVKELSEAKRQIEKLNEQLTERLDAKSGQLLLVNDQLLQRERDLENTVDELRLLTRELQKASELKEEERRFQIGCLYEIGNFISSAFDEARLTNLVVKVAGVLMKASSCSIMLMDDSRKELRVRSALGYTNDTIAGWHEMAGEGVAGLVAQEQKPIFVADIETDPRFSGGKRREKYRTTSFVSVPIISKGNTLGVLNVTDHFSGEPFETDDVEMLSLLATNLAIALENARLISRVRQADEEIMFHDKMAAVGRLAASVAHEINNPLEAISNFAHVLLMDVPKGTEPERCLTQVRVEVKRIARIVRSLLSYSRRGTFQPELTDVATVLENALYLAESRMRQEEKRVIRRYLPNLPKVMADPSQLEQVFLNLIINARQAMQRGGQVTISTNLKPTPDVPCFIEITFEDTGEGIPLELQSRVFEPFFTTKRSRIGTGLGLSVCRAIIQRHRGTIDLESAPGRGTKFTICLPVSASEALEIPDEELMPLQGEL